MRAGQKEGAKRSRAHLPPEHGSPSSCVRQKICFERATAFSLRLLLKKEERAGERRRFLSISPLSGSLPARSSRGERGKTPAAFCVPNTTGARPARQLPHSSRESAQRLQPFSDGPSWDCPERLAGPECASSPGWNSLRPPSAVAEHRQRVWQSNRVAALSRRHSAVKARIFR